MNWLLPWELSITAFLILLLAAWIFLRGRKSARPLQQIFFWSGWLLFYISLETGFDYYSEHAFFMHRVQHVMLHHLAPFLIALSRPGAALAAGSPIWMRQLFLRLREGKIIRPLIDAINHPIVACLLFAALLLLWLVPSVHTIAMLDWRWYRVMNWSMAIEGLMFWNLVLNGYNLRSAPLAASIRIAMLIAIMPPQIAIGALLTFSPHILYPTYALCGQIFAITPLADQQMGGMILWLQGAMMSILGIVTIIVRQYRGRSSRH